MARNIKKTLETSTAIEVNTEPQETIMEDTQLDGTMSAEDIEEQLAIMEIDMQIALGNSKVKPHYKKLYKHRAQAAGVRGKAAKRSTWDWLAERMASICLTQDRHKRLKLEEFTALMAANGIDCERWPSRTPGWEGRLRMTAGLVLRRQLAESPVLYYADGTSEELPADYAELLRHKFSL